MKTLSRKRKQTYKYLLWIFAIVAILSAISGLTLGYIGLEKITNIPIEKIVGYQAIAVSILILSAFLSTSFSNMLIANRSRIKENREENWKKVIISIANSGNVDKASNLFNELKFKNDKTKSYILGYIDAKK